MRKQIPNFNEIEKFKDKLEEDINEGKTDVDKIKERYTKLALLSTYININPNSNPV